MTKVPPFCVFVLSSQGEALDVLDVLDVVVGRWIALVSRSGSRGGVYSVDLCVRSCLPVHGLIMSPEPELSLSVDQRRADARFGGL